MIVEWYKLNFIKESMLFLQPIVNIKAHQRPGLQQIFKER